jgi:hypothetical protein
MKGMQESAHQKNSGHHNPANSRHIIYALHRGILPLHPRKTSAAAETH